MTQCKKEPDQHIQVISERHSNKKINEKEKEEKF